MGSIKSDIEIAREAKMKPIKEVLAKLNVPDERHAFSPMGRHIAKLNLEYIDSLKEKKKTQECSMFCTFGHKQTSKLPVCVVDRMYLPLQATLQS